MHKKQTQRILAIRPGRREMGVAVFRGETLRYWGIAGFRNSDSEQVHLDVDKRLRSLIRRYNPNILAMEKVNLIRLNTSPVLKKVVAHIASTSLESSLRFCPYSLDTVKKSLCSTTQVTRKEVVNQIVQSYPHLERYTIWQSRWQEEYWMPMFAAIAVGLICKRGEIFE